MAQAGNYGLVRSDSAVDFTAAILDGNTVFGTLPIPPFLGSSGGIVRCIDILSVDNPAWELWFFSKTTAALPAIDLDSFRGYVLIEAAAGKRLGGAGVYHYHWPLGPLTFPPSLVGNVAVGGLVWYDDEDYRTHKTAGGDDNPLLHLALTPHGASKGVGAAGAIVLQFTLEPVLGW